MLRIAIFVAAALALAGCSTTTVAPPDRPRLESPAAPLLADCRLPTNLPPGEMSQKDIERYWGLDRKHQLECVKRHAALRDFVQDRDAGLTRK